VSGRRKSIEKKEKKSIKFIKNNTTTCAYYRFFFVNFHTARGSLFASISLFSFLQAHSLSFGALFYLLHILVYSLSKFRLSFLYFRSLVPLKALPLREKVIGGSFIPCSCIRKIFPSLVLFWFESTKRFMTVAAWTSQETLLTSLTFNEFFLLLSTLLTNLHVFWC